MAVNTNTPPDTRLDARAGVRQRSDELNRDYIATSGSATPVVENGKAGVSDVNISRELLQLLEQNAQNLRHAAESVENRGLKLLLKVVAQERVAMYNALRQSLGKEVSDPLDRSNQSSSNDLKHGLEDIQSSMTVQRQGREKVTLSHLAQEEKTLADRYASLLQGTVATPLRDTLESQRSRILQFDARLQAIGEGVEPVVARVFDSRSAGEQAVTRLREQGLDASQIDAAPISQVERPVLRSTATSPTPRNTMAAGAFGGAVVGGIAGAALAIYVAQAPQLVGWVTVGPWALFLGALVIGAVFGMVFGFFIGQSRREDDLSVTADSLINGEYLVAAYPRPEQVGKVEDILQVHHARELNR